MIIRLILTLAIYGLFQFYFIKRVLKPIFGNNQKFNYKKIRNIFIVVYNIYPVAFLLLAVASRIFDFNLWQLYYYNILDYMFVYPYWTLTIIMFQLIVYIIPIDLISIVVSKLTNKKETIRVYRSKLIFGLFVLFTLYVPVRIIYDGNKINIEEYSYKLGLKEPLKIILIADVQVDKYTNEEKVNRFVNMINEQNPDIVLIAGDIITSSPDFIKSAGKLLGKIEAKDGVYSCVGDHDNWAYRSDMPRSIRELKESLKENGIIMPDNENLEFDLNGTKTGISFITDNYVERINGNYLDSLLKANNGDLKILLTHQPNQKMIDAAKENDFNMLFAGHTHGGQVALLYPFTLISLSMVETLYVRGEFRFDNLLMIVNKGLGYSLAPVRYNATPEISVINVN